MSRIIKILILTVAISIDWINDKLYYIDASRTPHYIGVLDIITTMFKKLIIGASQSRLHDIIVDPTTRYSLTPAVHVHCNSCHNKTGGCIGVIIITIR